MHTYQPVTPPLIQDASLREWLTMEFANIHKAANALNDFVNLNTLDAEPSRKFDGLTVLADGTNWNPGSGQGVYTYYASAWHKLG